MKDPPQIMSIMAANPMLKGKAFRPMKYIHAATAPPFKIDAIPFSHSAAIRIVSKPIAATVVRIPAPREYRPDALNRVVQIRSGRVFGEIFRMTTADATIARFMRIQVSPGLQLSSNHYMGNGWNTESKEAAPCDSDDAPGDELR